MTQKESDTRIRLVTVNNVVATVTPTGYGSSTLTVLGSLHLPYLTLPQLKIGQFDDISLQHFVEMFNGEFIELQTEYQTEFDGEFFGESYRGRVLHRIQVSESNDPFNTLTNISFSWKDEDELASSTSAGEYQSERFKLPLTDFFAHLRFDTIVPLQTEEVS